MFCFFEKVLSFYVDECMCFYDCMCAVCMEARRVHWISCPLVLHGCEPHCGYREMNPGPLPEQPVPLTHPGRDLGGARRLTTTFLLRLACVTLGSLWEACLKCVRGRIKRLQKRTRKPLLAFLWPEPLEPWKQENILFPLGLPDK